MFSNFLPRCFQRCQLLICFIGERVTKLHIQVIYEHLIIPSHGVNDLPIFLPGKPTYMIWAVLKSSNDKIGLIWKHVYFEIMFLAHLAWSAYVMVCLSSVCLSLGVNFCFEWLLLKNWIKNAIKFPQINDLDPLSRLQGSNILKPFNNFFWKTRYPRVMIFCQYANESQPPVSFFDVPDELLL